MAFVPKGKKITDQPSSTSSSSSFTPPGQKIVPEAPSEEKKQRDVGDIYGTAPNLDRIIGIAKGAIDLPRRAAQFGAQIGSAASDIVSGNKTSSGIFSKAERTTKLTPAQSTVKTSLAQPEFTKPKNTAQEQGVEIEKLLEFLLPVPGLAAAKTGGLATRVLAEGVEMAGKSAIQKEDIDDIKTDAIIGAAFPIAGKAFEMGAPFAGKGFQKIGQKIQTVLIKPSGSDVKNGFSIKNLQKYDIGGSVNSMFQQTTKKLNAIARELETKLGTVEAPVDVMSVFDRTKTRLASEAAQNLGDGAAIRRFMGNLKAELKDIAPDGTVGMMKAQTVKRGAGTKGAWSFRAVDPDATARETMYSAFYDEMKKEIENVARASGVPDVAILNNQLSDLIPIQSALFRRMPVAERAEILGFKLNMQALGALFDPRALVLMGADKILRSGGFAKLLIKASETLKGVSDIPAPSVYNPASHFLTPGSGKKATPTGIFSRAESAQPRLALPAPAMVTPYQDTTQAFTQEEIKRMYPNLGGQSVRRIGLPAPDTKTPFIDASRSYTQEEIAQMYPNIGGKELRKLSLPAPDASKSGAAIPMRQSTTYEPRAKIVGKTPGKIIDVEAKISAKGATILNDSPLLSEAKKYKTAKKFIDSKEIFYRGQPKGEGLVKRGGGSMHGNHPHFTSSQSVAKSYHDNIYEFAFKPEANVKKFKDSREFNDAVNAWAEETNGSTYRYNTETNQIIEDWAKANKIDGVHMEGADGVVFNTDAVISKPQLLDIYKKAHGK